MSVVCFNISNWGVCVLFMCLHCLTYCIIDITGKVNSMDMPNKCNIDDGVFELLQLSIYEVFISVQYV